MAQAAERGADALVLTSDNPRSEDPERILADMQAGLQQAAQAPVIVHRGQAIAHAIAHADAQDVVLLAGKGHEDYQEVQGQRLPFSDMAQAETALKRRRQGILA